MYHNIISLDYLAYRQWEVTAIEFGKLYLSIYTAELPFRVLLAGARQCKTKSFWMTRRRQRKTGVKVLKELKSR
jgi:hypothetical protein